MGGYFAMRMAGRRNFQLGTKHQRMGKLVQSSVSWPAWMPIALAGIAPPWLDTKSIKPKLMDCTRGCAAISKAR